MRPFPIVDPLRLGLFTIDEAGRTGWTGDALRHAASRGSLRRIRAGVYAPPREICANVYAERRYDIHERAVAAALTNAGTHISHTSSGVLHDVPLWILPDRPCLTVPPRFVGDIADAHLHRAALPRAHRVDGDPPYLSIERTIVDIGREHGELSALVVADGALHLEKTTAKALQAALGACRGWPGVRAAREAITFADPRAESPLETASRYKLRGLVPRPETQVVIRDVHGTFLGRADFYWDEFGVIGEADGKVKYNEDDELVLVDEKARQASFERCKLGVVRWGRNDLDPIDRLVARLHEAFAAGRRRTGSRQWHAAPSSALHL